MATKKKAPAKRARKSNGKASAERRMAARLPMRRPKRRTRAERFRRHCLRLVLDEERGTSPPRPANTEFRRLLFELLYLIEPRERAPDPREPWRSVVYELLRYVYELSYVADRTRQDVVAYEPPVGATSTRLALLAESLVLPATMPRGTARIDRATRLQARAFRVAAYTRQGMFSRRVFTPSEQKEISDFLARKLGKDRDPAARWRRVNRGDELEALRASTESYLSKWRDGTDGWTKASVMRSLCQRVAIVLPRKVSRESETRVADELTHDPQVTTDTDPEKLVTRIMKGLGDPLPHGAWNYLHQRATRGSKGSHSSGTGG